MQLIVPPDSRGNRESPTLFPYTHTQYAGFLEAAQRHLQLPFAISPHQMRHSAPSNDRFQNRRSRSDIKSRGFWKSDSSVALYEKHALLLSVLARLSAEQQRAFAAVRTDFRRRLFQDIPDFVPGSRHARARPKLLPKRLAPLRPLPVAKIARLK